MEIPGMRYVDMENRVPDMWEYSVWKSNAACNVGVGYVWKWNINIWKYVFIGYM